MGVPSFYELRAWQSARTFKLAIYRLIAHGTLATDFKLRDQLRESARDAVDAGHITDDTRVEHQKIAQAALAELTSLLEYLQSPPS